MKKEKQISKRILMIILALAVWVCACGLGYDYPELRLDDNPVYIVCDMGALSRELSGGTKDAYEKWNGRKVVTNITVSSVSSGTVTATASGGYEFDFRLSKTDAAKLPEGTDHSIFGTLKIGRNNALSIAPDLVRASGETVDTACRYYVYNKDDGSIKGYSDADTTQISLGGGRMNFRVPSSWMSVRYTGDDKAQLFNSNLVSEAECFYLSSLTGARSTECFIAFFFDESVFVKFDSSRGDHENQLSAIISNICPENEFRILNIGLVGKDLFNGRTVTTDFGTRYYYHVSPYENHRVEFIASPVSGGLCVMMYVTADAYHFRDDALYIQRTLNQ